MYILAYQYAWSAILSAIDPVLIYVITTNQMTKIWVTGTKLPSNDKAFV